MAMNCPVCGRGMNFVVEPGELGSVIGGEWVHEDDGSMECEPEWFDSEGLAMGIAPGPEHDTEDEDREDT